MSRKGKARGLQLYLFKEMDGPTSLFFLVSDSCDLWAWHTRGIAGAISQQYNLTLHHSNLEHCGVKELELSCSRQQRDSSKHSSWNPGMTWLSL